VDKWKSKKWYSVKAPALFEHKELCEVVSADPKKLKDRIITKSLMELGVGGSSQIAMFTTLKFRIDDVSDAGVNTRLIGHLVSPSFIKTFARRGKSLIHEVVDGKTKDGEDLRIKIIAVTGANVSQNTRRNLREALREEASKAIVEKDFNDVIQDVIFGRVSSKLYSRCKQITKMRRVEVRKSERGEQFK
jgi:small subunit ribosomal protein S3Ae